MTTIGFTPRIEKMNDCKNVTIDPLMRPSAVLSNRLRGQKVVGITQRQDYTMPAYSRASSTMSIPTAQEMA